MIAHDACAGIGKDQAGANGLALLNSYLIAGATVDGLSARMSDAVDMYENGTISFVNRVAERMGISPGMKCNDAALKMLNTNPSSDEIPKIQHVVHELVAGACGRARYHHLRGRQDQQQRALHGISRIALSCHATLLPTGSRFSASSRTTVARERTTSEHRGCPIWTRSDFRARPCRSGRRCWRRAKHIFRRHDLCVEREGQEPRSSGGAASPGGRRVDAQGRKASSRSAMTAESAPSLFAKPRMQEEG